MGNFVASYNLILEQLRKISDKENLYYKPIRPKPSDIELIALIIWAEYKSVDSEYQLFRELIDTHLCGKIERSVYNIRKRKLFPHIEYLKKEMAKQLSEFENYFVADSMPLEVCKISRNARSKICEEQENAIPNKGYCASQNLHYYAYKLHAVCSVEGVFQSIGLTPASVHDIHYLKDIQWQLSNCTLLGDKGYLSAQIQLDLFNTTNIQLETPQRVSA